MSRLGRALALARSIRKPDPTDLSPKEIGVLIQKAKRIPDDFPDPKRMSAIQLEAAVEAALVLRAHLGGVRQP